MSARFFEKPVYVLMCVCAGIFLTLFFALALHARIAGDDFYYLYLTHQFGAWKGMIFQYENWSGRWAAHYIGCLFLPFWNSHFFMLVTLGITFSALFNSVYSILKKTISSLNVFFSKKELLALNTLIISALFFSSFDIHESWFWYIIVITYLWSLIGGIYLIHFIFSPKNSFIIYTLIALITTFIGGASESYALIFIFLLLISLFANLKLRERRNKIIFALMVLLVSFYINTAAPGMLIRNSLLPSSNLGEKIFIHFKATFKLLFIRLPFQIPVMLLFLMPWLWMGNRTGNEKKELIYQKLKISFLFFCGACFLFLLPTTMVMSEAGPDRALLIISFSAVGYISYSLYWIGKLLSIKKTLMALRVSLILSLFFLCITLVVQLHKTSVYSDHYDQLIADLEKKKIAGDTGIVKIISLPDAGYLFPLDLSDDTSYFSNQHLRKGLFLPFSVSEQMIK